MNIRELICCGILTDEINKIVVDYKLKIEPVYFQPNLHVNPEKMKQLFNGIFNRKTNGPIPLIYGSRCHPCFPEWIDRHNLIIPSEPDCIEIILGKMRRNELEKEQKTFFVTPGWIKHWEHIFKEGLHWDDIDARINFGRYDRILLLDTGVCPIDEDSMLGFFDYTGVPIEIYPASLSNLKTVMTKTLRKSAHSQNC
ncbi:DUF1638 domain-containing protein [Dehalogenimonas sp. THU2]|uniref:DUF1638 domain-containing protein n=1 Tax=Dehalogenimonas sp. THU2 TaxID=3151121 RepID=UPI00321854C5